MRQREGEGFEILALPVDNHPLRHFLDDVPAHPAQDGRRQTCFRDIVVDALFERAGRQHFIPGPGDQDNRQIGERLAQGLCRVEAAHTGQVVIKHDAVEGLLRTQRRHAGRVLQADYTCRRIGFLSEKTHDIPKQGIVIDEQEGGVRHSNLSLKACQSERAVRLQRHHPDPAPRDHMRAMTSPSAIVIFSIVLGLVTN